MLSMEIGDHEILPGLVRNNHHSSVHKIEKINHMFFFKKRYDKLKPFHFCFLEPCVLCQITVK
jgi:hypothetical protein